MKRLICIRNLQCVLTETQLSLSLRVLANALFKAYNHEVLIIIDEYDAVFNNCPTYDDNFEPLWKFMTNFYAPLKTSSPNNVKSVIMGSLYIHSRALLPNNFTPCTFRSNKYRR